MKRLVFLLAICIPIVIIFIFIKLSAPVNSSSLTKNFIVNKGDGIKSIALRLETNNLVNNRNIFIFHAYLLGLNRQLQAGSFSLSPSLSTSQIVSKLTQGGRFDVWFKIIDGQRNEEIIKNLPDFVDPKAFLLASKDKIGRLYPDSYLLPTDTTLDQLFTIIDTNFNKKLIDIKKDSTSNLTDQQILILASLIEREARTLNSKQQIAGIFLNRLKINMALQVDASVQFAKDSQLPHPKDYWQPVVKKDLNINSPYNTYKTAGLPPTPICNPGYDAIYAAYHPIGSDYLFYITGHDNLMHYAKTLDEHNANITKYLK